MKNLFIDIHAIQTVPPSCVNRDDTGSPKTARYGGTERARISSQAWKHAMREYFKDIFAAEELGSRTKHVADMIAREMLKIDTALDEQTARKRAAETLKISGIKIDDKTGENAALFFISRAQAKALAELALSGEKDKKAYQRALKENPSLDIVLFGRMAADDPNLNYDAAAQVAHAISTHAVHTEYDYFTAVDDLQSEDQSGAGHLGTVEFNSATLYRYAAVNVAELAKHLGADAPKAVRGFAEAFIRSMPTGKQNTFANRTLPDMVYVTVRGDQPVNLSGAFENAVKNGSGGFVSASCKALLCYASRMYDTFADSPQAAFGCGDAGILAGYAQTMPLKELLVSLEKYTADACAEEEA